MPEGIPLGYFVWFELMTTNPDAAREFYREVVGWDTSLWEEGEQPYTMWMAGEKAVGGVMELPEEVRDQGAPPHWMAYISTPDVDETVRRVAELGGKVHMEPTDIPNEGRFAVLEDPQGVIFSVHKSIHEFIPPEGPPPVGHFSWHELITTDYEAAFGFYSDLFGWKKTDSMEMGEGSIYQMYGLGDRTFGGMYNKPDEWPVTTWLFYVSVEDVHPAAEKVKELGGEVLHGPMEVPGGDFVAICRDPQGGFFALHSRGLESGE